MEKQKRIRINISIAPDTAERLKQYAYENHTNVSQAITDWIWSANVKNTQLRGQESLKVKKVKKQAKMDEEEALPYGADRDFDRLDSLMQEAYEKDKLKKELEDDYY